MEFSLETEMKTQTAETVRLDRLEVANSLDGAVSERPRKIAFRSSGHQHGPITRLVSPSDIGELIKPFVFLDHAEVAPRPGPLIGIHPHSGIATLTTVLRGGLVYEDTTGKKGEVAAGGQVPSGYGVSGAATTKPWPARPRSSSHAVIFRMASRDGRPSMIDELVAIPSPTNPIGSSSPGG